MPTFEEQLYGTSQIPDAVKQVESESGFYEHPLGVYIGKIGSMDVRYVDHENKKCKPEDIGAIPARIVLKIYLTKYLGPQDAPQDIQLLSPNLDFPPNRTSYELYYPVTMSLSQKFQWVAIKMFENFVVPGINDSQIVKERVVRYDKIQLYYGLEVKFVLDKNKKGFRFISEIAQLDTDRFPIAEMKQFEFNFKLLQDSERESKNDKVDAPAPNLSVDDLLGGTIAPNPAGNDNGEYDDDGSGLPF